MSARQNANIVKLVLENVVSEEIIFVSLFQGGKNPAFRYLTLRCIGFSSNDSMRVSHLRPAFSLVQYTRYLD